MNIFEKDTIICGDLKNRFLRNSLVEVLEEAQSIREILGEAMLKADRGKIV